MMFSITNKDTTNLSSSISGMLNGLYIRNCKIDKYRRGRIVGLYIGRSLSSVEGIRNETAMDTTS